MRIETNGLLGVAFVSLLEVAAGDFETKTFTDRATEKTEVKTAPDGRPVFRTSLKGLTLDDAGKPSKEEQNLTLAVIEPCDVSAGVPMVAAGRVWVTHYVTNNNRLGVSIIAERLEPLNATNPFVKKD